jgi:hypothetical protein
MPLPMVAATLRWKTKIATTLKKAAKTIACCGLSTPVETTVAIEFAASWKPFMKSNSTASTTSSATTPNEIWVAVIVRPALAPAGGIHEFSRTMPSIRLATSSQRSEIDSSSS